MSHHTPNTTAVNTDATTTGATAETTATAVAQRALAWFEIPVQDMDRAQRFYETLLGQPLRREQIGPNQLAVLPYTAPATGGCLLADGRTQASAQGTLIYLASADPLDAALARLAEAGGRVTTARVDLPGDMGCFVHFEDCEGNRLGLHALS